MENLFETVSLEELKKIHEKFPKKDDEVDYSEMFEVVSINNKDIFVGQLHVEIIKALGFSHISYMTAETAKKLWEAILESNSIEDIFKNFHPRLSSSAIEKIPYDRFLEYFNQFKRDRHEGDWEDLSIDKKVNSIDVYSDEKELYLPEIGYPVNLQHLTFLLVQAFGIKEVMFPNKELTKKVWAAILSSDSIEGAIHFFWNDNNRYQEILQRIKGFHEFALLTQKVLHHIAVAILEHERISGQKKLLPYTSSSLPSSITDID